VPVGQHPQNWENFRTPLHLIDHNQSREVPKRRHRLLKPGKAQWILEVEIVEGVGRDELAGKGRLAALARAQKPDDSTAAESGLDGVNE
jgi:hypothetical protein